MRILSIETSGRCGSVAVLEISSSGEIELTRQTTLPRSRRTAQCLAPALQETLITVGWPADSVGLVAVTAGPGSFTGLRIGVTAAKLFAYATDAQVRAINTLEVLAAQAPFDPAPLWTVLDAHRSELFAAKFAAAVDHSGRQAVLPTHIVGQADWLCELESGDIVTGLGLSGLADDLPSEVRPVDSRHWQPLAESVGRIAWRDYQAGCCDDVWQLVPQYYRLSAAEEKRLKSL